MHSFASKKVLWPMAVVYAQVGCRFKARIWERIRAALSRKQDLWLSYSGEVQVVIIGHGLWTEYSLSASGVGWLFTFHFTSLFHFMLCGCFSLGGTTAFVRAGCW